MTRTISTVLATLVGLAGAGCAGGASPAPTAAAPKAGVAAANPGRLRAWLTTYAADSMEGREAGTAGNVRATAWLAAEAARLGLEPAGDEGTWFQVLPLQQARLAPGSTVEVAGRTLAPDADMLLFGAVPMFCFGGTLQGEVPTVYGGRLGRKEGALT
ncbi:MAG TPA: hypothetical protein VFX50_07940, partial [Gemmatimonadales bacterium]|nr:hypothetical protein [Gemmatimonadales bacterium]